MIQKKVYILWMALCSSVPMFVDQTKMTHSWGSKFVVLKFSFMTHTERLLFLLSTGICGLDPPRKPQKIGTPQKLSHPQYFTSYHNVLKCR